MGNKVEKIKPRIQRSDTVSRIDPRDSSNDRGYNSQWRAIRYAHLRQFPVCETCKRPATDVHHRIDRRKGGNDSTENLQSLCHSCHSKETAKRRNLNGNKSKRIDYFEPL